jgi:alpha-tubulin suppressor-like RCC1 family protein
MQSLNMKAMNDSLICIIFSTISYYSHKVGKYINSEKNKKDLHSKNFHKFKCLTNEKVMISHGTLHTLALTETGPVYGLDSNVFGQLGIVDLNSNEPVIIEINGIKIKKLC